MNGINVLMDINSGAVHAVDDVAYDIADLYTEMSFDEICDKFSDKYSREQLKEAADELEELKEAGMLYTEDEYEKVLEQVKNRAPVVKALCLHVAHDCNLRCTYCRSGMETFIPHESVLRYEEMKQLVDMAMDMGVEKVRLTGGEPFARKGFADFLERLRAAHPALDIRVTTNGTLIGPHIQTLKAIGLNAVNLSLDTFDRDKFEQITGRDLFGKVRENMDALLDAGIPFKLNAVAMRGFNDDELPAFVDYAMHHPIDVRFIEFMPMGEGTRWSDSCFWSAPDILDAVKGLVAVVPVEQEQRNGGPARLYTLSGPDGPGLGRLGLISPLSSHFCTSCNRLRITSDGALRTCLFDDREYRLRNALRHPKLGIEAVRRIVTLATRDKPIGARLLERRHNAVAQRRMTAIGG